MAECGSHYMYTNLNIHGRPTFFELEVLVLNQGVILEPCTISHYNIASVRFIHNHNYYYAPLFETLYPYLYVQGIATLWCHLRLVSHMSHFHHAMLRHQYRYEKHHAI